MYDDFFAKASELSRAGVPFATAVVVRAERPTSGKPGDKAIVTADGVLHGWIGGSCAQPVVVREALAALREDRSRLIRISPDPGAQPPREGLVEVPMSCYSGGTLEIFIEPQPPRPRLLVVGGLPVARALAQLGRAMSYHVVVVDPAHAGVRPPYADELLADVAELPARVTPLSYVVVATHGEYDEAALEVMLRAGAPYVGLVASRRRAAAVRAYLAGRGLDEAQLAALVAPAGLDIGARRGDEIALSIMAEIVRRRRAAEHLTWVPAAEAAPEGAPPATAIDPVCGMEVQVTGAKYFYEHAGVTYYFCCPGCRTTFQKGMRAEG